jgi:hypothetical protein
MARRGGTARFLCPEEGCTEAAFYNYSSNAAYARLCREQRQRPWKCSRHRNPEQVLTPANTTRTVVLIADRSKRFPDLTQLFWRVDGDADVGSGYLFGPGFSAHADDFPKGSRLVITVTADLAQQEN